jgi:hypothetical protein
LDLKYNHQQQSRNKLLNDAISFNLTPNHLTNHLIDNSIRLLKKTELNLDEY